MRREELGDLAAFLIVAKERSFTRAAAQLGTSQSALSYTVRRLEARLGVRLLNRTTRSVAPTVAGERLLGTVAPRFDEIDAALAALSELRDKPSGTIRITAGEHAADAILWPALERFLPGYPDIKMEAVVENGLTDIVAGRYDAGVRLGEQVAKDMVAARIGPDIRMAVVGTPSYFAGRPRPKMPGDLTDHGCINLRLPTPGGLYVWEFEKGRRALKVRVEGQLVFNTSALSVKAAVAGWAWPMCPRTGFRRTSPREGSSGCWLIGASLFRDTTSTIQAVGSPRRLSRCWLKRCDTGTEAKAPALEVSQKPTE